MIKLEASADTSVIDEFENIICYYISINSTTCALFNISIVYESSFFVAIHINTLAATNIGIKDGPIKSTCTNVTNNQSAGTSAKNDSSYFEFSKNLKFEIKKNTLSLILKSMLKKSNYYLFDCNFDSDKEVDHKIEGESDFSKGPEFCSDQNVKVSHEFSCGNVNTSCLEDEKHVNQSGDTVKSFTCNEDIDIEFSNSESSY